MVEPLECAPLGRELPHYGIAEFADKKPVRDPHGRDN